MGYSRNPYLSINNLLRDPLIRLVMTADRVSSEHLCDLLQDVAQRRRIPPTDRENAIPGVISITPGAGRYRPSVGMILINREGRIFVGRKIDIAANGALDRVWQMPQGGIVRDESPAEAALRELHEEIGTDNAEIITESHGWFRYDLPEELREEAVGRRWHGQIQKWLVLRFLGTDADIDIATEHAEFDAWRWVDPEVVADMVVYFKRDLYRSVMAELSSALPTLDRPADFGAVASKPFGFAQRVRQPREELS